ncbi:uncharacterized protein LOC144321119 isoform X2 [Canis aureus]
MSAGITIVHCISPSLYVLRTPEGHQDKGKDRPQARGSEMFHKGTQVPREEKGERHNSQKAMDREMQGQEKINRREATFPLPSLAQCDFLTHLPSGFPTNWSSWRQCWKIRGENRRAEAHQAMALPMAVTSLYILQRTWRALVNLATQSNIGLEGKDSQMVEVLNGMNQISVTLHGRDFHLPIHHSKEEGTGRDHQKSKVAGEVRWRHHGLCMTLTTEERN